MTTEKFIRGLMAEIDQLEKINYEIKVENSQLEDKLLKKEQKIKDLENVILKLKNMYDKQLAKNMELEKPMLEQKIYNMYVEEITINRDLRRNK